VLRAVERRRGRLVEIRIVELDTRRQLDVQFAGEVDVSDRVVGSALEDVPAPASVGGDEMQVIPVDLEPLGVVGEPKARDRAGDVAELEHALLVDHLPQRPVRG